MLYRYINLDFNRPEDHIFGANAYTEAIVKKKKMHQISTSTFSIEIGGC